MSDKHFIHKSLIKGEDDIPDLLITIWYYPHYKTLYDAYDFQIIRMCIQEVNILNKTIGETVLDQYEEGLDNSSLKISYEVLLNDGIIEDLIGNHFRNGFIKI